MHIGGMRTALFNWLFARRNAGQFVLRIDDTDQQRNVQSALAPILAAFRWLGLDWDEGPDVGGSCGPYFQSHRQHLYAEAVQRLLVSGQAYRDFEPPEETRRQREAAEKARTVYVSSRVSLELDAAEAERRAAAGEPHVIRFLVPRGERIQITDHIRGDVEWDGALMPDPVIARNDGTPLYNFATVIDDALMKITHVIRAEEHLSNTPIQVLLHRALGHTEPEWAHLPYVAAPGGKEKLSKRRIGAYRRNPGFRRLFELGDPILSRLGLDPQSDALSPVMVEYYQRVGFLPAGLLNALARLGWSLDDQTEFLSLDEIRNAFSLDRVVRSAAGLDPDKLISFQTHWFSQLSDAEKVEGCLPFLRDAGWIGESPTTAERDRVLAVVQLAADRLRVFGEILQFDEFFAADEDVSCDEAALERRISEPGTVRDALELLAARFEARGPADADGMHELLKQAAADKSLKPGKLFPAVRLAVTGKSQGPDLFRSLALCGAACCARRLRSALNRTQR